MDDKIRKLFDNLRSDDKNERYEAFLALLEATDQPVDWAYECWDDLLADLRHPDNHRRAIASQLLCNLAQSDPKRRMLKDFSAILEVTRDKRFVTARHTMQALWKVGAAGEAQRRMTLDGLARRFEDSAAEKNCTLIRYDICVGLRKLSDVSGDAAVKEKCLELIERETDPKYRKKYLGVWKK